MNLPVLSAPARTCAECGECLPHACAGIVRLPDRLPPVTRRRAMLNAAVLEAEVTAADQKCGAA